MLFPPRDLPCRLYINYQGRREAVDTKSPATRLKRLPPTAVRPPTIHQGGWVTNLRWPPSAGQDFELVVADFEGLVPLLKAV